MELNNLISHFPFEIFNQKFKMYLISGLLNIYLRLIILKIDLSLTASYALR